MPNFEPRPERDEVISGLRDGSLSLDQARLKYPHVSAQTLRNWNTSAKGPSAVKPPDPAGGGKTARDTTTGKVKPPTPGRGHKPMTEKACSNMVKGAFSIAGMVLGPIWKLDDNEADTLGESLAGVMGNVPTPVAKLVERASAPATFLGGLVTVVSNRLRVIDQAWKQVEHARPARGTASEAQASPGSSQVEATKPQPAHETAATPPAARKPPRNEGGPSVLNFRTKPDAFGGG